MARTLLLNTIRTSDESEIAQIRKFGRMMAEEAMPWGLAEIQDADLPRDIVSLGFIKGLQILEGKVSLGIEPTTPACPARKQIKQLEEAAQTAVAALPGVGVTTSRDPHSPSLPGVPNSIAAPPKEGRRR